MYLVRVTKRVALRSNNFQVDMQNAAVDKARCRMCDMHAALRELEKQCGLRFVAEKLPRGSMLLEVRMFAIPADLVSHDMHMQGLTSRDAWQMVYQRMEQQASEQVEDGDKERAASEAEEAALLKVLTMRIQSAHGSYFSNDLYAPICR